MDEHHILHVIDLIFDKMRERLCNGDFSFLLMPLYPGLQRFLEKRKTEPLVPCFTHPISGQYPDSGIFCDW